MALVKGTKTANMNIGASYSAPQWYFTQNHTQDTGSDGMLVVVIASTSSLTLTNVKYAGVTMSQGGSWNSAPGSTQYAVFYLANPATGSNALTVDSNNNGTISLLFQSFTGADTTIQVLHNDLANTPHSQDITVNAGSTIMGIGSSLYTFDVNALLIDHTGISFSGCDLYGSISTAQFCAHTLDRVGNLSAGTKTVITDTIADSFQATNTRVEIKEKAVTIVVPTVITTAITSIAQTTATSGGNVTADGGATVTARGVCWSASPNPTTANYKTTDGSGTGSFTSSITGLTANTGYFVRAYATNSAGTGYGSQEIFVTLSAARRRIIII